MKTRIVKDFIYVDQIRLYSLYSQINKGIAQQIFQSVVHGEAAKEAQPNPDFEDEITESQRSKSLQRTESTILYDYIYEQLEDRLRHVTTDVTKLLSMDKPFEMMSEEEVAHYFGSIDKSLMVKVKGQVEIEDYKRLDDFLAQTNTLMEAFAALALFSRENVEMLRGLEEAVKGEKDRNKKAQLNEQIRKLKNPKLHAEELSIIENEQILESLRYIIRFVYSDRFEIAVKSNARPYSTFRAVINREWLRVQPDLLNAMYGGIVESEWTLVGQITSTARYPVKTMNALNELQNLTDETLSQSESLRDPVRFIFNRAKSIEAMLNQSKLRIENVVHPLAIYREIEVPDLVIEDSRVD